MTLPSPSTPPQLSLDAVSLQLYPGVLLHHFCTYCALRSTSFPASLSSSLLRVCPHHTPVQTQAHLHEHTDTAPQVCEDNSACPVSSENQRVLGFSLEHEWQKRGSSGVAAHRQAAFSQSHLQVSDLALRKPLASSCAPPSMCPVILSKPAS